QPTTKGAGMMKTPLLSVIALIAVLSPPAAAQTPAPRAAGAPKELRVGIVTLLSGPASSTFGIPAKKAADAWVEKINDEGGIDGIGAARYLLAAKPDVKTIAGLNQDYAWGRDSWEIFSRALRKLKPDVQVVETLWPKLFQGDLSAEISKLLTAKPDVIFHSLWGTDLASVNSQGRVRGLFRQSLV